MKGFLSSELTKSTHPTISKATKPGPMNAPQLTVASRRSSVLAARWSSASAVATATVTWRDPVGGGFGRQWLGSLDRKKISTNMPNYLKCIPTLHFCGGFCGFGCIFMVKPPKELPANEVELLLPSHGLDEREQGFSQVPQGPGWTSHVNETSISRRLSPLVAEWRGLPCSDDHLPFLGWDASKRLPTALATCFRYFTAWLRTKN